MQALTFRSFYVAIFISLTVFTLFTAFTVHAGDDRVRGQYIVVLKDSVQDVDAAESDIVGRSRAERFDSYRKALKGFSAKLSDAALAEVKKDPRVDYVAEDRIVTTTDMRGSLDTSARSLATRGVTAQAQTLPTGVNRIDAENLANKGAGVNVAVIDTGITLDHPDLKANIVGGKNCTAGGASNYKDQNGHGTHVAGTIAGIANTQGVVGVAPSAKLWAVRVLDASGSGTWSQVICGLDFVASKGPKNGGPIKVANLSLGGSGVSDNNCGKTNSDPLHAAICRVRDAGVTVVVAAGNNGGDAAGFVPAAYNDAVITVSALVDTNGTSGGGGAATSYGADDTFASFSNYGSVVDIGAPGVNIYSTWLGTGYATISGTSMASPHVTGAAALYIATHAGASWTQVRDALIAAGEASGSGHTDPSGKHPERVLKANGL